MQLRGSVLSAVAASTLVILGTVACHAHAQLSHAVPLPNSSTRTAPSEVTLNFSDQLEGAFSSVIVRDVFGKRVDNADGHVDKTDRTVMRASLQPLAAGTYTVEWRVVSVDTHKSDGTFTFRVGE